MKSQFNIVFIVLFVSCFSFSQEEEFTSYSSEVFNSEQIGLNLLSSYNLNQLSVETNRTVDQQNILLIQQVGFNNSVISQTYSESSNIELYQNGDNNSINFVVNAPSINSNILQNGNNNSVLDNIYYSNLDVKLNAIQNGDNLTINRIGVNSLSNKLQLVQEGSFKTITVISN